MITKNYYFKSRFRTLNCVRTTYLVNKKFQTTNNLCYCRCMSTTQLICRTTRVTVLVCQGHNLCFSNNNSYHCCCLSITQLMSEAKLVLLLNFNNTTYVSNNSYYCCCMSTTQFMCRTAHVSVVASQLTTTYVSNNSCHCCPTAQQFVSNSTSFNAYRFCIIFYNHLEQCLCQTTMSTNNSRNIFSHFSNIHLFKLVTAISLYFCSERQAMSLK